MMEDPKTIKRAVDLILVGRHLVRIADHATNIAETVYYIVEGRAIAEQRPKGDTTSFAAMIGERS